MSEITRRLVTRVGVDIAKKVIYLHAVDGSGQRVYARSVKRDQFLAWCQQQLPPGCVVAMEASVVALGKARDLAAERGVAVDFRQSSVEDWDWSLPFDAVVGVFIQFAPPALRAVIHAGIAKAVVPGGLVLLHGYAPRQIGYGTGGPPVVENLYTLEALRADFPGWTVLRAEDYDADLSEGTRHVGKSALIDFIARKP